MKSTGVVRKIDELGRFVLPIELRKNLGINNRDAVEIFVEDDKIILKKYEPSSSVYRSRCRYSGFTCL